MLPGGKRQTQEASISLQWQWSVSEGEWHDQALVLVSASIEAIISRQEVMTGQPPGDGQSTETLATPWERVDLPGGIIRLQGQESIVEPEEKVSLPGRE